MLHGQQISCHEIAKTLDRSPSTISREIDRNSHTGHNHLGYRASSAQLKAEVRAHRPKISKLAACPQLSEYVQEKLACKQHWSPEQISYRLVEDFPDDEHMRISDEAIYQALYVQGRGGLRKELTASLRSGHARRQSRYLATGR